ncbi:uncharacterized protein BDR25DRAFT_372713 [Lindgomyces ingoldianus]|uniref:Uncharacterized protein n=1 Tax=Lindgomyces ingoldianus TaxID=673940 RepID=A0ACB6QPC1_9PLEO|nr:uncharacterized protein BDR25DRAFT_372713 [Lindgomyces ingoldianus]KAF2468869.1 hypothetical protein BDR25DRAFT_372713 [Lindgomyces ingoldianus]
MAGGRVVLMLSCCSLGQMRERNFEGDAGLAMCQPSANAATATLPKLLAVNKEIGDLDEQIRQATRIIRLPNDWQTIQSEVERYEAIKPIVRARAEWVLRWILDKLKNPEDTGAQARANPRSWKLVQWMLYVLPVSRSATQLRDADFLAILERALQENFEKDFTIETSVSGAENVHKDVSESSETVQEDPKPSRKRKRTSGTNTPSKRVSVDVLGLEQLFVAIVTVVKGIAGKVSSSGPGEETVSSEYMKVALRTESAQAARILKFWLMAVQKFLTVSSASTFSGLDVLDDRLSLSFAIQIWELRSVEATGGSGTSADQFSAECLIPTLELYDTVQKANNSTNSAQNSPTAPANAAQSLEKVLVRYLFGPARASFYASASSKASKSMDLKTLAAKALASNLEPLRARIQQAAEILDSSEPIPDTFLPFFRAIPQLLDLAIKFSPIRSPKSKIVERPWIQAAFVALAECAGCSLEAPKFMAPVPSVEALEKSLGVLTAHNMNVDTKILEDLFWFHSGFTFPLKQKRTVCWPLIAALIKLDPDIFLPKPRSTPSDSSGRPVDLSGFLFDKISMWATEIQSTGNTDVKCNKGSGHVSCSRDFDQPEQVVHSIIVPLMSAYARNRDLLGFISRWDSQLIENMFSSRTFEELEASITSSIWEDRSLNLALVSLFEKSLTQSQVLSLFEQHQGRVKGLGKTLRSNSDKDPQKRMDSIRKGYSSSVILNAFLDSLYSDEAIEALKPQLWSLFNSYTSLIRNDSYRSSSDPTLAWTLLCKLWTILWPIELHGSSDLQKKYVDSLISRACQDAEAKDHHRNTNSPSRVASLTFLLTAFDCLISVPGWQDLAHEKLQVVLGFLSTNTLDLSDFEQVMELLCARFSHLLDHIEPQARDRVFTTLFSNISEITKHDVRDQLLASVSQSLLSIASPGTIDVYLEIVSKALDGIEANNKFVSIAEELLLQVVPAASSRTQREALVDKMTDILITRPRNVPVSLSVMAHLMELPNSTAKICSSGSALFDLAQSLHDNKLESALNVDLFQELVQLTLDHILKNKDQPQNAKYLEKFKSKLTSATKKASRCYPARLAILKAAFAAQKDAMIITIERYLLILGACLNDTSAPVDHLLDAFNEIPSEILRDNDGVLTSAQSILLKRIPLKVYQDYMVDGIGNCSVSIFSPQTWVLLHRSAARFQLYGKPALFLNLSIRLLREELSAQEQRVIFSSVKDWLSTLTMIDKLKLVGILTGSAEDQDRVPSFRILHILISALDDAHVEDTEQRQQQLLILPSLCQHLSTSPDPAIFNALLDSIDTILRGKTCLLSQHNIESVLTVIVVLSSRISPTLPSKHAPAIYARLCETSRLILLLHRSRLGGRFHLLLQLLQNLLFCLFIPNANRGTPRPPWLTPTSTNLSPVNSSQYSRLLSCLCSPTTSSVSKHSWTASASHSQPSLNDPVKAAREYASHHLYPLLAAFCRFQLNGRLEPAVRERLLPGIWDAVSVAGLDREALEGMNAGLDSATRAVWKGVWGEWRRRIGGMGEG